MSNSVQFTLRGLLGFALVTGLSLALWRGHALHQGLADRYSQIVPRPMLRIWDPVDPASGETYYVGIGKFNTDGRVYFPLGTPLPQSVSAMATVIRARDGLTIAAAACRVTKREDTNSITFVARLDSQERVKPVEEGFYFVRIVVTDEQSREVIVAGSKLMEFADYRALQDDSTSKGADTTDDAS